MAARKGGNSGAGRRLKPDPEGNKAHREKIEALMTVQKDLSDLPEKPPAFIPRFGKKLWTSIVPQLQAMGLVKEIDQTTLELLCSSYDTYRKAYNQLKKVGFVTADGKKNPLVNVMNDSSRVIMQCCRELGLTYSSRASMVVDRDKPDKMSKHNDDPMHFLKVLGGGKE